MSNEKPYNEARFDPLKNENARQRWQLFHRAIAHAKQSNSAALQETDGAPQKASAEPDKAPGQGRGETRLSIAR